MRRSHNSNSRHLTSLPGQHLGAQLTKIKRTLNLSQLFESGVFIWQDFYNKSKIDPYKKMSHLKKKNKYKSTTALGTPSLQTHQLTRLLKTRRMFWAWVNVVGHLVCLLLVLSRATLKTQRVTSGAWPNFLSAQLRSRDHTNKLKLNARQTGKHLDTH